MSSLVTVVSIVTPAVTGVAGYLLAGVNEEKRDERQAARESAAREADRAARLQDRNHDFQRELLLGLQEQGRRLVRSTFHVIAHDIETLRDKGQMFRLTPELNQDSDDAGIAYLAAMNRVTDDGLRHHLRTFYEYAVGHVTGALPAMLKDEKADLAIAAFEEARKELVGLYVKASEALGERLRKELSREG